jgi:hypothetical protein
MVKLTNDLNPSSATVPIGTETFALQRAEDEPWLSQVYIPPNEFSLLTTNASFLINGAPGTGKTALFYRLKQHTIDEHQQSTHLMVAWQPHFDADTTDELVLVEEYLVPQIMRACAEAVVKLLVNNPLAWQETDELARETLRWFVVHFAGNRTAQRAARLQKQSDQAKAVIEDLTTGSAESPFTNIPEGHKLFDELLFALDAFALQGIWILNELAEHQFSRLKSQAIMTMRAFLSSLAYFEHSQVAFKLVIPEWLMNELADVSAASRRRIKPFALEWTTDELKQMVETRLAHALGKSSFKLQDLCMTDTDTLLNLEDWLVTFGNENPRDWFDLVLPILRQYLTQASQQPFTTTEWLQALSENSPYLKLDPTSGDVFVGTRHIPQYEFTDEIYELLSYLYNKQLEIVSKQELYYRAILNLDYIPSTDDPAYDAPTSYEGMLDTRMYRLRQIIQPGKHSPELVFTIRGKGYQLRTTL